MAASAVRRRRSALAAGFATLAMTLSLSAAPAQAIDKYDYYVALGDSYAAGIGGGEYLDGNCERSANAYSEIADDLKTVKVTTNAACGGATTEVVVNSQLGGLDRKTDLVTITAGGNDLDSIGVLVACSSGPESLTCADAITAARTKLLDGSLAVALGGVVTAVKAKAPNAKIVLTGYPLLFDPSQPFAAVANPLTVVLNGVIEGVADDTDSQYVDVAGAFTGHGIGSEEPWINYSPTNSSDNFHPNAAGYRDGYFAALSAAGAYKP